MRQIFANYAAWWRKATWLGRISDVLFFVGVIALVSMGFFSWIVPDSQAQSVSLLVFAVCSILALLLGKPLPDYSGKSRQRTAIVIVESPFAGDVERNRAYVAAALADCLARGEAPFASHAIYTLPGVLDDDDPLQRRAGIEAGFAFHRVADLVAVYIDLGVTDGMRLGIARAQVLGIRVEYRTIPARLALTDGDKS